VALARDFPGYGFERHMGYGTPEHMAAIARLGPCALHRTTWAPFAQGRLAV
jgi:ribonuclease HII